MDVTTANGADSHPWLTAGRQALVSGTLASFFSTAALALFGKAEARSFVAPTNATSHWLWGNDAYSEYEPSLRHTGVGYVTHHASAVFWALFYERWLNSSEHHSTAGILRDAALTAGVAAVVDYTLTPERLRPGFEQHLSRASLVGVFAAFAAGLAAGALLNRQHERRLERLLTLPE
jgi:hypothetical protein